jgi:hypothetical protein
MTDELLDKDRFTVFDVEEIEEKNLTRLTNPKELKISLVEGQTAKELADYILLCQKNHGYWMKLSDTIILDDDFIETSIRTSEFEIENKKLKRIIEGYKQEEKKNE